MASIKLSYLLLLVFTYFLATHLVQGSRTQVLLPFQQRVSHFPPLHLQESVGNEAKMDRNSRRLLIGSTAPTCTYNECRGCKYKCKAEQVPVEGNDPINSAYHYKCVCHRS
ncbi:EPIDERMAL PATTERNING FACTOR-like protein 9 [Durio zibethinus]|uniref:EPIDERMAL PATTERNING FACTOR-like protein 9 n=1 Tax=Durio zibethinus TaxID=66656 RepID=A0A6P5XI41_DURZI|nr:EPIDERMAL PATTERNING FACTOR-like protein 9 [Durio zibethinus]